MTGPPLVCFVALGLLAACRPATDSAQGVAERFVEAHYVEIDLAQAKSFTAGPARTKIEEEQRLVGDQRIDQATRKPRVSYRLEEKREEGDGRVTFLFRGKIEPEGLEGFSRRWLISTRRNERGDWVVSNFQEFD